TTAFRHADGLHALVWQTAAEPRENLYLLVQPLRRNHSGDRLANHLRRRIAQYSFGAGVPSLDDAVDVLRDDSVARKFNNRRQSCTSQFGTALFSDIAKDHYYAERPAVGATDRGGAVVDRNLR